MKDSWVTKHSSEKLSSLLGLNEFTSSQDWQFIHADPKRIDEFLTLYEHDSLTDDDRFALMALILSSFDERILPTNSDDDDLAQRLRQLLIANLKLHECTIWYWCVWDEPDTENQFRVTPFMRETWTEQNPDNG